MNDKISDIKKLATVLEISEAVRRFDQPDEPGSWRVAYALSEIGESIARVETKLMPKLAAASDAAAINSTLHEIGEQLRHVLYHVKDSGYFDYLMAADDE